MSHMPNPNVNRAHTRQFTRNTLRLGMPQFLPPPAPSSLSSSRRPKGRTLQQVRSVRLSMSFDLYDELRNISSNIDALMPIIPSLFSTLTAIHAFEKDCLEKQARELSAHNTIITQRLETRNETIAHMFAEIDRLEYALSAAADRLYELRHKEATSVANRVCLTCFEEVSQFATCSNNHTVCTQCLERECRRIVEQKNPPRIDTGISCMSACSACDATIPLQECMRCNSGCDLVREIHWKKTKEHVISAIKIGGDQDSILKRLSFMRADGEYNARQCAQCGYGPIVHAHCDDLSEHHQGMTLHGARYNNACPSCGAVHADVRELNTWNGT